MSITKKIAENASRKSVEGFISPEDKKYMEGKPNRIEVANYVNGLLDNHYMPLITNYIQMSSMVLQAILIEKGVCTGDEIKDVTEKFVKENRRRMKENQALKKLNEPVVHEMENGLVERINQMLKSFSKEDWKTEELSEDVRKSLYTSLYGSMIDLINLNINPDDQELINEIAEEFPKLIEELTRLKKSLDNGTLVIKNTENGDVLKTLITDVLQRLSTQQFTEKSPETPPETSTEGEPHDS